LIDRLLLKFDTNTPKVCKHCISGVSAELKIAQEERVPYFLLKGRADLLCVKPRSAKASDKVYNWTWDNLKVLINGGR
jgi:hypothetical protein